MTALYIILLIIVLIMLLPVGVYCGYDFGDIVLRVVLGPVKIQILPKKPKKKDKPKKVKTKKTKKPKKKKAKGDKLPFTIDIITDYARLAGKFLNRFRKKLSIDHLQIWYLAASDDPYDTAMAYGKANAAVTTLLEVLHCTFNIKNQDVRLRVDFAEEKSLFSVCAQLTIRIGQLIVIALIAAFRFIRVFLKQKKLQKLKAERIDENGEASHRRNDGDHNVEDQGNGGRKHNSGHAHNNA